jgi:UDP-glucose 4-epimerase
MKILITGISGFIGSALFQRLKQLELHTIDNLSFGNKELIKIPDSHFFIEDIRNRLKVFEIIQTIQPDWVTHLAAIHFIPYCNQHPFESSQVNIEGTKNILDACEATPSVKKVLYASTAAVYPIMDGPIHEEVPTGPLDIYGLSKLTGEYLCRAFHERTGVPTIICRFFNAFGPNETNPHLIPAIQEQINLGKREIALGNLEPKRDFIHTSDMANAIEMLLNKFDTGIDVFNLGQGREYSVMEIVQAFEDCLGEPIKVVQDPARMRKSDRMHLLADITKLKSFTGWEPKIGITEGIRTLIHEQ